MTSNISRKGKCNQCSPLPTVHNYCLIMPPRATANVGNAAYTNSSSESDSSYIDDSADSSSIDSSDSDSIDSSSIDSDSSDSSTDITSENDGSSRNSCNKATKKPIVKPATALKHQDDAAKSSRGAAPALQQNLKRKLDEPSLGNAGHSSSPWSDIALAPARKIAKVVQSTESTWTLPRCCPSCKQPPISVHRRGCTIERCSMCGDLMADHLDAARQSSCSGEWHDAVFARWTGFMPGKLERLALRFSEDEFYGTDMDRLFSVKPKTLL
jgi:hypothetical protein